MGGDGLALGEQLQSRTRDQLVSIGGDLHASHAFLVVALLSRGSR